VRVPFLYSQDTLINGQIEAQYEVLPGQASQELEEGLAQSRRIELRIRLSKPVERQPLLRETFHIY
jgi:hypothetical protein